VAPAKPNQAITDAKIVLDAFQSSIVLNVLINIPVSFKLL